MSVIGYVDAVTKIHIGDEVRACVTGWARNTDVPEIRPVLHILIDNNPVGLVVGELSRRDLILSGMEDGVYGFRYPIPQAYLDGFPHIVTVKVYSSSEFLRGRVEFSDTQEKKKIVVCAIVRNEANYIIEWICHHLHLGVDHFVIYDNESNDDTNYILTELESAGIVTHVHWRSRHLPNPQVSAYKDCLSRYMDRVGWVGFLDIDEFFNPISASSIPKILELHQGADAVAFNWRLFGSAGQLKFHSDPVTERFEYRAIDDFQVNNFFKTFARPESIEDVRVHHVTLKRGIYVTSGGTSVELGKGTTMKPDYTSACINHYVLKSAEEWEIKRKRGMADRPSTTLDRFREQTFFDSHDRNEIFDDSLRKFSKKLFLEFAKIRKLGYYCNKYSKNIHIINNSP